MKGVLLVARIELVHEWIRVRRESLTSSGHLPLCMHPRHEKNLSPPPAHTDLDVFIQNYTHLISTEKVL